MLKIFKFSLLFTLSLNLFANSITTDFMQKDFKITYEWLAEKPKSSAKDFFILQYLENEDLSYENAKKAYDMRNGRNALLDKAFKQKFNEKISPEDRFCYNASILELKNSDSRCITLGLASLKKASDLSKEDLAFFISKLDTYPTLKNNLILISSNDIYKKLINGSTDKFLEIFFEVSDTYRYKYLNQSINPTFLHKIAMHKDFEKFLRTVVYDKKLKNIQKSLDNLKTEKMLTTNLQFLLRINAVNHRKLESAKQFFQNSYDIYNAFSWLEVTEDSKKSLDDAKMEKYSNLFTQKSMEPHLAFILERYNRFRNQYFITPYEDLLKNYGIYKKVLIYSIAKQESRFIPSSISFSSAMGIMQIMPFLSKDIASKLGDDYNIYDQFLPEKNIQYASFHLDSLIKQFDSNPLFIAYAYNGGAGYARSQLQKGLFKDKSEFEPFLSMEMISYNETREYGKKVLANFYIYNNYLNSENKISLSSIFQNLVWHH